ncbi:MAG TPA: type VI secretion system tube protein TssD [Urbifossiella sp.]|jgi:type VI secretion system secreted protein Hcp|nr:type VI secretion system tube protein TssD [Urbifossiella sp.]
MALNAYLTLKGQKQGDIKGSVTQKGRENSIMVVALSHSIISPRDMASGLPSGKRMHKPLVITANLDMALPLLYNALVNNENLTEWKLKFWSPQTGNDRTTGVGSEVQNYTIDLVNANVASIDFRMANNLNPELMRYPEFSEIAFTYQKITWTWVKGGVTASDDWETPVA